LPKQTKDGGAFSPATFLACTAAPVTAETIAAAAKDEQQADDPGTIVVIAAPVIVPIAKAAAAAKQKDYPQTAIVTATGIAKTVTTHYISSLSSAGLRRNTVHNTPVAKKVCAICKEEKLPRAARFSPADKILDNQSDFGMMVCN